MPTQVAPGQVYHLLCQTCAKPKNKFFVVATVSPVTRCFLINSAPSPGQARNPDLMAALIPMLEADHPFLDWNSYLAMTDLIGEYKEQDIASAVAKNPKVYRGVLAKNVITALKAALPHNKVLPVARIKELTEVWKDL
ncbi:hypothetical protein [Luteibacter sp. CQ10]|uniref:hypothetical protein n=1 Tax=Luteibacter sp. CQ10 TaxID=2805821 RepID=UPI0034A57561